MARILTMLQTGYHAASTVL